MRTRPSRYVLRALMRAHSLKSPDIARLVNYQPQTVRSWLCGTRNIPARAWRRIITRYPIRLDA